MAGALIVIEIAAPKVSEGALSVLVSACSRAARDAECVLARNASDAQPAAVAIVTLQSEDKMRVEVGVRQGDHDSWRTKDFAFLPADQSMDRWRAVGFAIGTLAESNPAPEEETSTRVGPALPPSSSTQPSSSQAPAAAAAAAAAAATAATATAVPAATPKPKPKTKPERSSSSPSPSSSASPSPSSSEPEDEEAEDDEEAAESVPTARARGRASGTQMFVGAAAIFGPGLDRGPPWRLGGALYADLALARVPVFFTIGGSAATRLDGGASGVTTRWFDVLLGAGVPLLGRLDASGLELRAQVLAEYFDAHASILGRSQTMSRWAFGLQGTFGGRLQLVPDLLLTAEIQAAGLSGETEVLVGGASVGSSASFRYLGSLGLRVQLR